MSEIRLKNISTYIEFNKHLFKPVTVHQEYGVIEWIFKTDINEYLIKCKDTGYKISLLVHGGSHTILETNDITKFRNFFEAIK